MTEDKKYVTFRDLRTIDKAKQEPIDSTTSTPSITSTPSTTSTSGTHAPSVAQKITKKPKVEKLKALPSAAPERDFQRIPNSVTRQALPEGIFRGKSKQVWDYLWSVSRGAVTPIRSVRKSRREIKAGSGLGSMVTVDAALEHLRSVGLIKISPAVGSLVGNEYEVFTPEESYTSTSSIASTSSSTSPTQNLVHLDIPESGISSTTQVAEKAGGYSPHNTFFKTKNDDDEYTHTARAVFEPLAEAARVCVRGEINLSNQEQERWRELGQLLADELRNAAGRTDAISSAPAFLAAHLRRRLSPQSTTGAETAKQKPREVSDQIANEAGGEGKSEGKQRDSTPKAPLQGGSKYSLDECRRFADHLHKTGQGITNPGGYATTIYRTGEADELIEEFLKPAPPKPPPVDASQCPDCKGTGYWYPGGMDKGVALCKHESLLRKDSNDQTLGKTETDQSGD